MACKPFLFYDSGAGGLPYLAAVRTCLSGTDCPAGGFVYLADRKNFPLGEKPPEIVRQVVLESISLAIRSFDPGLIVIACNTASVVALEALRDRFPIPFVGVVPAVKPAALSMETGKIAVLATSRTSAGPYLENLIRDFSGDCEVIKVPVAKLVDFAEYHFLFAGEQERLAVVERELAMVLKDNLQAVVLGCTHFVLLEEEFRMVLPDQVAVIDSREGVTNRILTLLEERAVERGDCPPAAELYLHGGQGEEERYRAFAARFELHYGGIVEGENR
jgi:glutamate racemase